MNVLIVDDNDTYAKNLIQYFESKSCSTKRAYTAKEGDEFFKKEKFDILVTDITMETQTSGLFLARRIFKSGFQGKIIIATTGFDQWGVLFLGKYFLPYFAGVHYMIPKVPLKKGIVEFHPTTIGNEKLF
jgi:CheY-like chemotaxis protein